MLRLFVSRELLLVGAGVAVIFAMIAITETARRDAQRHQTAQVLVERVRASSQQVGGTRSRAWAARRRLSSLGIVGSRKHDSGCQFMAGILSPGGAFGSRRSSASNS